MAPPPLSLEDELVEIVRGYAAPLLPGAKAKFLELVDRALREEALPFGAGSVARVCARVQREFVAAMDDAPPGGRRHLVTAMTPEVVVRRAGGDRLPSTVEAPEPPPAPVTITACAAVGRGAVDRLRRVLTYASGRALHVRVAHRKYRWEEISHEVLVSHRSAVRSCDLRNDPHLSASNATWCRTER